MRRRDFIQGLAASAVLTPSAVLAQSGAPRVGMGTWLTFDVGRRPDLVKSRTAVLRRFFELGGGLVDSSPMYGTAERVLGEALTTLQYPDTLIAATKVWKLGAAAGEQGMAESRALWGVRRFDLMQVHNLLDWRAHLPTLLRLQEAGQVGTLGVTTSHGRRHGELLKIIREQPQFETIQLTYNIVDRDAERVLLPAAAERGRFVIVNRPFQGGRLFDRVAGKPIPAFARELGCASWADYFLRFILSHPAVGCAIPATTRVDHMSENMAALKGPLPDRRQREMMRRHFQSL